MTVSKSKFVGIKGCAVYAMRDGQPLSSLPQVDNTTITPPTISFGTTSVNMMGTVDIPDTTSIDNLQLSVNIPVDNPDAAELNKVGYQSWKITYVVSNVSNQGVESLTPCVIYAEGFIPSVAVAEISKGGDGMAEVQMNLMKYRKIVGNEVKYDIDRSSGTCIIEGVNYNTIDSLY